MEGTPPPGDTCRRREVTLSDPKYIEQGPGTMQVLTISFQHDGATPEDCVMIPIMVA